MIKNKKGKGGAMTFILWIVGIAAAVFLFNALAPNLIPSLTGQNKEPTLTVGNIAQNAVPAISGSSFCTDACPSNLAHTATVVVQNLLNTSGTAAYNSGTLYFFQRNADGTKGVLEATGSGGAGSGTAFSLSCGKQYQIETVPAASTSIAAGDNFGGNSSRFYSTDSGTVDTSSGSIIYNACGIAKTVTLGSNTRGQQVEIRDFDNINNGFAFDYNVSGSGVSGNTASFGASTYKNQTGIALYTGFGFSSSTNGTNLSVSAGGELHETLYIRPLLASANFNDQGILVGVDANANRWLTPTIKIDGEIAPECKATCLNSDELKAYSQVEYFYLIPSSRAILKAKELPVEIDMFAVGGIDPLGADAPVVHFLIRGKYVSTLQNNVLKIGSVRDDSTQTLLYPAYNATLAVA